MNTRYSCRSLVSNNDPDVEARKTGGLVIMAPLRRIDLDRLKEIRRHVIQNNHVLLQEEIDKRMMPKPEVVEIPLQYMPGSGPAV